MQRRMRHALGYQPPVHEKEGRRAKLRREAEDLREMLRVKERELEEMGDGG